MSIGAAIWLIALVLIVASLQRAGVRRNRSEDVFGGVCAGVANRFGWDVTVVRIITIILALSSGITLIAYLLLWVILD